MYIYTNHGNSKSIKKKLNQKLKLEEGGKEILKENLFRRKQNQLCLKSLPNHAKRELTK